MPKPMQESPRGVAGLFCALSLLCVGLCACADRSPPPLWPQPPPPTLAEPIGVAPDGDGVLAEPEPEPIDEAGDEAPSQAESVGVDSPTRGPDATQTATVADPKSEDLHKN